MEQISEKWFAIINPVAGNGKGLADWPYISKLLRDSGILPDYAFTEHKYHAVELTVTAVIQGYRKIISIGGDGTLHEIVNGLFIQKMVPASGITIGVIPTGNAMEWVKLLGVEKKYPEAVKMIASGYSVMKSVAKISYHKASYNQSRYMAVSAGIGLNALTVWKYARKKDAGRKGKRVYITAAVKMAIRHRSSGVKIWVDGKLVENNLTYSGVVTVCDHNVAERNGGNGCLELIVVKRITKFMVLGRIKSIITGTIYRSEQLSRRYCGKNIRIESSPETGLQADGESLGYTPLKFEIVERAINVINPHQKC